MGHAHTGDLRNVIKPQTEITRSHAFDHFRIIGEQAVFRHRLVIEGRQHQHATAAKLHRMAGHGDRIHQRAHAGAGQQHMRINAIRDQTFQQALAFLHGQRIGFARRAEHSQTIGPLAHQPMAYFVEQNAINRIIGFERRDSGNQNSGKLRLGHDAPLW